MRLSISRCLAGLAGALLALSTGAAAAEPPTLVVAVDTSRSLQASAIGAAGRLAGSALAQLPADARVGVLAFNDTPRWVLPSGSPAEAGRALAGLTPGGRYTLLDDALFTATRAAQSGAVVVLITDGKDENSATTIEDVARACEAHRMRVVTIASGRHPDERTLRRLALLTGGAYLGRLDRVTATQVAAAATAPPTPAPAAAPGDATAAGAATASAPRGTTVPVAMRVAPAAAAGTARDASGARGAEATAASAPGAAAGSGAATAAAPTGSRWWWLALPLGLLAVAVPVAAAVRSRATRATTFCRRCGGEVVRGEDCPRCAAEEGERALQERLRNREVLRLEDTAEFRLDLVQPPARMADGDVIEKTRVLSEQAILVVREPGTPERTYLMRTNGAFAIGRDGRSNTLALGDVALSGRHLKLVPEDGAFYVVDLDSTNGTYLNRRRVRAAQLHSGDLMHAGQVELEFRSLLGGVA